MRGVPSALAARWSAAGAPGRPSVAAARSAQAHVDVVVLAVGRAPVADRRGRPQRAQRPAICADAEAEVGGGVALQLDRRSSACPAFRLGSRSTRPGIARHARPSALATAARAPPGRGPAARTRSACCRRRRVGRPTCVTVMPGICAQPLAQRRATSASTLRLRSPCGRPAARRGSRRSCPRLPVLIVVQRVAHLGELAHAASTWRALGLGDFERRADRRVELDDLSRRESALGTNSEPRADHEEAADEGARARSASVELGQRSAQRQDAW